MPESEQAAVEKASQLHPVRCEQNRPLYRTMFLVADTADYKERGLLLVKVDSGQTETQRLPVASEFTTTVFNEHVKGYRPWKHTHSTFLISGGMQIDEFQLLEALDKKWHKRYSGADRFLNIYRDDGIRETHEMLEFERQNPWRGALRKHPMQVYRERFCQTLVRHCFVYRDKNIESGDQTVTLAKLDWNGVVEGKTLAELWSQEDLESKVTTMECPAHKAYETLIEFCASVNDS